MEMNIIIKGVNMNSKYESMSDAELELYIMQSLNRSLEKIERIFNKIENVQSTVKDLNNLFNRNS